MLSHCGALFVILRSDDRTAIGGRIGRENHCFVFRDSEYRQRAFEYAFDMAGACISSDDPTNRHREQAHDEIQRDLVSAELEAILLEAGCKILAQIAVYFLAKRPPMVGETENGLPPGRVLYRAPQNAPGGDSKSPSRVLVRSFAGSQGGERDQRMLCQGVDQFISIGEIVVEGPIGDLRPRDDIADRERFPFFGQYLQARGDQLVVRSFSLLVAS